MWISESENDHTMKLTSSIPSGRNMIREMKKVKVLDQPCFPCHVKIKMLSHVWAS